MMETKKRAAVAAIEQEYDNKIAALEMKKNAQSDKLALEGERYIQEIERIQAKLMNPEPQTTPFRKLRADEAKLEKELLDATLENHKINADALKAQDRRNDALRREFNQQQQKMMLEERLRQEDERRNIEQIRAAERQQEEMRAIARCKEANEALYNEVNRPTIVSQPTIVSPLTIRKKVKGTPPTFPLDLKKKYSYSDLIDIEIDYDTINEQDEEIYEKACAYAARRDDILGWTTSKHNKYANGDVMTSEDFEQLFK
jgi:hypothetical protein